MEPKNKIIIAVSISIALALTVLFYIKKTKADAVKALLGFIKGSTKEALSKMDRGYLISRAAAFKDNEANFTFKDKLYVTATGRGYTSPSSASVATTDIDAPIAEAAVTPFSIFDYNTWF